MLDEKTYSAFDHLGWRLWRAARMWKAEFERRMAERGFSWYSEGRSALLAHIGDMGIRQSTLVRRMGLSKQAVQQLVDELAAEDAIARRTDPADTRGRIITRTAKGAAAARASNEVKREIDNIQRHQLGAARFEALTAALRAIAPDAE